MCILLTEKLDLKGDTIQQVSTPTVQMSVPISPAMLRRNVGKTTWVELSHDTKNLPPILFPSLRVRTQCDEDEKAPLRLLQVGILCHNSSHMTSEHLIAVKQALKIFLSHSMIGDRTTLVTFHGDTAHVVLRDDDCGATAGFVAKSLTIAKAAIDVGITAGNTADLSEGIVVLNSINSYDAVILIIDGIVWEHRGSSWENRGCV